MHYFCSHCSFSLYLFVSRVLFLCIAKKQPIYIGFGSMVIDDTTVLENLLRAVGAAAAATNSRVLVQSSWATFDDKLVTDRVFVLNDRVPHHWLFQRCRYEVQEGPSFL